MLTAALFIILSLVGFVVSLIQGSVLFMCLFGAASSLYGTALWWIADWPKEAETFWKEVDQNKQLLRRGAAEIGGRRLSLDETVSTYRAVVGGLLWTETDTTRPLTADDPKRKVYLIRAQLTCLLFGWWAFPYGPVHTLRALRDNAQGRPACTVRAAMAVHEKEIQE